MVQRSGIDTIKYHTWPRNFQFFALEGAKKSPLMRVPPFVSATYFYFLNNELLSLNGKTHT